MSDDIDKLAEAILASKKNSNSIIDLLKHAGSSSKSQQAIRSIGALSKVFGVYLSEGRFRLLNESEAKLFKESRDKLNAEEKYREWMNERYNDFKKLLLERLTEPSKLVQLKITCLDSLFDLMKYETVEAQTEDEEKKRLLPLEFLQSVWNTVLTSTIEPKLLKRVGYYLAFDDVRYFTMKYLLSEFYSKNNIDESVIDNLLNLFALMPGVEKDKKTETTSGEENVEVNQEGINDLDAELEKEMANGDAEKEEQTKEKEQDKLFLLKEDLLTSDSKVIDLDVHRKLYNDCLVQFLKNKLTPTLYKKLLIKLPEKILPKMTNPLMLADFLTISYNNGGLIGLLALNSLFVLITRYNLEYPNFYHKVYQMLDASIFYTKYKDRFFHLLDMFLLSTHLSSTLVAAFIKKLSRMSLTCPPADLKFLVLFTFNLLIRHQNCKVLIHKKTKIPDLKSDPYDINCLDFNQCNALKSSIWEIQSLKSHYSPYVSKEVEKINILNTSREFELDDAFENNSYDALINLEIDAKKATANCAVNYFFDKTAKRVSDNDYYDETVTKVLKIN